MPHVTDDTDTLQEIALLPEYDYAKSLPRVLPPSRRGGFHLLAFLRRLITAHWRGKARQERLCNPRAHEFETLTDILARKHPYLYIKTLSG